MLKVAFAMVILDLISRVHLVSFVVMLPRKFKYSTFPGYFDLSSVLRIVALRFSLP